MNDESWAALARNLADALMKLARERDDASKKRVAALNTEVCAARREELQPPPQSAEAEDHA